LDLTVVVVVVVVVGAAAAAVVVVVVGLVSLSIKGLHKLVNIDEKKQPWQDNYKGLIYNDWQLLTIVVSN